MSSLSSSVRIESSPERVWEVMADLGGIARWHPGISRSRLTTEETAGPGAGRRCEVRGGYAEERVVEWRPGERLAVRIVDTSLPLRRADIRFDLEPADGATRVTASVDYEPGWGPLGPALDLLVLRPIWRRWMGDLLEGLRRHLEEPAGRGRLGRPK